LRQRILEPIRNAIAGTRLRMSSNHAAFIAWDAPSVTYMAAMADSR
jgi:hypothetical protein